jgi:hypothetical protein
MEVRPAVMHRLQSSIRSAIAPATEAASDGRVANSNLGHKATVCGPVPRATTYIESKTHTLRHAEIRAAQLAKDAFGVFAILRLSLS